MRVHVRVLGGALLPVLFFKDGEGKRGKWHSLPCHLELAGLGGGERRRSAVRFRKVQSDAIHAHGAHLSHQQIAELFISML